MTRSPKRPLARVRRVLDVEPLDEAHGPLVVRPFEECFDRGSGMTPLVVRGEIRGGVFQVSITGRRPVELRGTIHHTPAGPCALLEPQEHALDVHHVLRVDADAHDADGCYAAISYLERPRGDATPREIEYAERWCSIYFNPAGTPDGASWGGPQSVRPRAAN